MKSKHTVKIEEFREVMRYLREIESTPLENIKWMKNGKEVKVTKDQIDEWRFTGLNNRDFAKLVLGWEGK